MLSTYDVSLVVEGIEWTDETLDRLFRVLPDAIPAADGDVITVTAPATASDAETAGLELADTITEHLSGAIPVRVDQDLVAISDIASRTGRTRESVRLLTEGEHGPGGFPSPVGTVGGGTRVWPWATVVDWFRTVLGQDLDEQCIPPEAAAVIDANLAGATVVRAAKPR